MTGDTLRRADKELHRARKAVSAVDIDELPDEIAEHVRQAEVAVLSAKGAVEIERKE